MHRYNGTRSDGLPLEEPINDEDQNDKELHDTDDEVLNGKGIGEESGSDTDGDKNRFLGKEPVSSSKTICGTARYSRVSEA